ncbi:dsRNA-specific nuclease [Cryomyces antarcticus]
MGDLKRAEPESGLDPVLDASDSDDEVSNPNGVRTISDRRRAQNAKFRSWLDRRMETVIREDAKQEMKAADDEELSIRNLMAKQESHVIISDPREYQIELFERAKAQNIIAVLDTGSGKTLIAVLLLKYTIDQELENRGMGKQRRVSFFLVDSVTLVFQQFAVLECNLDHKVERFCGAMGVDLWTKDVWAKQFAENEVIVCTAEVLVQCLMHSFISIEQINLLIFDEAHHAKKSHPYARIIKDFYLAVTDLSKRPRIFGMTASPVDAKVNVVQAASELETLLHSQICTTSDISMLSKSVSRPAEEVAVYPPLKAPFETPLHQELKARFGDVGVFQGHFLHSTEISSELGKWCSDYYWSFALQEEQERKVERRVERRFHDTEGCKPIAQLDAQIARLKEAGLLVRNHSFGLPERVLDSLSSKVLKLYDWLSLHFERPSDARCIVFVEKRHTAQLLENVFSQIGGPNLRTGTLIGTSRSTLVGIKSSLRQQVMTLIKFRKGELNCLFSTSIAEEGLDIPDCNLIVRFDLYKTMIQYIQSRGRARHRNSKYLHMIEAQNPMHRQALGEVQRSENLMRQFCQSLPADRLLRGNDDALERMLEKHRGGRTYTEASTGAKLTYWSSLSVLSHFVGCLPQDAESSARAIYVISRQAGKFLCEVILPENSPVRAAIGRPSTKKSMAKCSAAFEACILLRKGKYLDDYLLPIYTKQLPAMRNALLALNMKKSNMYTMRLKPSIWESSQGLVPEELFVLILDLTDGLDRPHLPLALLTRTRLPEFPWFPLYLDSGKKTMVRTSSLPRSFRVSSDRLDQLTAFTLRMSYWLAPLSASQNGLRQELTPVEELIDWETIRSVHDNEEFKWTKSMPNDFLTDKFLIDRWDGGRRFYSKGVVPGLKALDPLPEDATKNKYNDNILDSTVSLWAKARAKATWDLEQPVLEAEKVLQRRNMLAEPEDKETTLKTKSYLCPEPLKISALPTRIATMCLAFPAIIHRLESYLIAIEACEALDIKVRTDLALEAITKDADNTEEHQEHGRIHFQRGMGKNYERLEFMGDCFLKMATSISLFTQNPDNDEYEFHVKRMLMICNQNLFDTAVKLKLYEYIRSMSFSRRTWYPEGLKLLEGKGANKTGNEVFKHSLGDKTIADVCEALIGAAFLAHNKQDSWKPEDWDDAVKAVTNLVCSPDHDMHKWTDYLKVYKMPGYQIADVTASQRDLAAKVELEHDYHFRWPRLLRSAFVHPSYPFIWEKVPSYQRLEFLGDSLLDMASIAHLFYRFPQKDPQWLTEHKMAMVSNKFLGAVCVRIGFHRHLRHNSSIIEYQIREYVTELQEAERDSNGARNYWTTVKAPPKCLPDIVESYVGAIFVDSGFDYNEVQRFFDTHIKWFFDDMSIYDTFANNHPTTHLHHILTNHIGCRDYRILAQEIPSVDGSVAQVIAGVMIHDEVAAEGRAKSGKNAKVKASLVALDLIKGMAPFEFRAKFGCDCKPSEEDEMEVLQEDLVGSAI